MISPRGLYSTAPRARTKSQDNPTLLVSWWCTGFALAFIVVRIGGRYVRTEKLFREDKIIAWSIVPLLARMALVHLVLIWGTNNAMTTGVSELYLRNREMGSKLVLVSRIIYAAFLWITKFSISEFLKRLTAQVWKRSYEIGLQCVRWSLVFTFLAVVIATLAECQPFPKYWQVQPDPGPRCRQGYVQLITMGSADVLTDLLLVCFPIPIIIKSTLATKQKVSLVMLFGLSLVLVAITLYRVVAVIDKHSEQQFRSLLTSLHILAAAVVSNAVVLGSFVRDRGAKKQRFRFGSVGSSSLDRGGASRRGTQVARHWGSDADLVGDLGIRLEAGLSADEGVGPRPAPMAIPLASHAKNVTPTAGNQDWECQEKSSVETKEFDAKDENEEVEGARDTKKKPPCRRLSLFDVGGLLDDHRPVSPPCYPTATCHSQSTSSRMQPQTEGAESSVHHNRLGRDALLQDIGGLLMSEPAAPERRHKSSFKDSSGLQGPAGLEDKPTAVKRNDFPLLNDVGGLLA